MTGAQENAKNAVDQPQNEYLAGELDIQPKNNAYDLQENAEIL